MPEGTTDTPRCDTQRLRALSLATEAEVPSPWGWDSLESIAGPFVTTGFYVSPEEWGAPDTDPPAFMCDREETARYLTLLSPNRVRALCDEIDRLRAQFAAANTYIASLNRTLQWAGLEGQS